jgi:hypothetical protein
MTVTKTKQARERLGVVCILTDSNPYLQVAAKAWRSYTRKRNKRKPRP